MWLIRRWRSIGTIVLVAILFSQVEGVEDLWAAARSSSLLALTVAFALNTLDRVLMTYKWLRLLVVRGFHVSIIDGMKIYCTAMIWGQFLPSSVGADAIRAYATTRIGGSVHDVVTSIAIERLGGILVTAVVAAGGLLLIGGAGNLDPRLGMVWWASAALVAAALGVVVASTSRPLFELLERVLVRHRITARAAKGLSKFQAVFQSYRRNSGELALFVALTAAEQLFPIVITMVLAMGMGLDVPAVYLMAGVPIAYLFSRMPISLGGLGVYEGVLALVLGSAGVTLAETIVLSLSFRVTEIAAWVPWWLLQTREAGSVRRPTPEPHSLAESAQIVAVESSTPENPRASA